MQQRCLADTHPPVPQDHCQTFSQLPQLQQRCPLYLLALWDFSTNPSLVATWKFGPLPWVKAFSTWLAWKCLSTLLVRSRRWSSSEWCAYLACPYGAEKITNGVIVCIFWEALAWRCMTSCISGHEGCFEHGLTSGSSLMQSIAHSSLLLLSKSTHLMQRAQLCFAYFKVSWLKNEFNCWLIWEALLVEC